MIKYETINNQLCRMVEPEPLQLDSELPCVVRLIQDDSPMGRYNQSYSEYRYGARLGCCMLPIIATHIAKNGVVNDIEWDVSRYEIIGYPVEDGSHYWALYQMMQGKKVCNPQLAKDKAARLGCDYEKFNTYWYVVGDTVVEGKGDYGTLSVSSWIAAASSTGWQLYNEPEPAKEQFEVGDWVEYSDGTLQQAIIEAYSGQPGEQMVYVWHPQTAHSAKTPLQSITRKLSPSEVVIHIGCLSGTVEKAQDYAYFLLWHSKTDCDYSMIKWSAIDTPTREMVERLLKAQEEEK